ncbi:MAG: NUDIX hydrolase [Gammaproteobacteria bacterium]|nr:NUDIX hydrolase [Gammaproteobacteria bacterium]
MHRSKLLQLLAAYSNEYPNEAPVCDRFVAFVEAQVNCFSRVCWEGHVTGSTWLVDPHGQAVLLTHHKKLQLWLQLGGHSDGDSDTTAVALREAQEESGLEVQLLRSQIFDIDIHEIPARKADPAHFHFDVRFAIQSRQTDFVVSEESMNLAWVPIAELEQFTTETSILRMREKWYAMH